MIAFCGANCLLCDSYIATQSGNPDELLKVAKKLTELYHTEVKPEYVVCDGCRSEGRHSYFCGNLCKMRRCCEERAFYSCIECSDFPCPELQHELNIIPGAKENLLKLKK